MNIHLKAKHPFWLNSGRKLESLRELHDELKVMAPAVFAHHVTATKNDFALWVEHSLEHPTLAGKLKSADKEGHLAHIGEALAHKKETMNAPAQKTAVKKTNTTKKHEPKIIVTDKRTILTVHEKRRPIVSKHRTELHLHHEPHRVVSHAKTPLTLVQQYERVFSENKTLLSLTHSVEKGHHGLLIMSYLSLGLVFGAGLVILILAL